MTAATPIRDASPLMTFAGVGAGSQLATIILYFIQTYMGHPLPDPVTNAITGFTAATVAYIIHKVNNSN